MWDFAEQRMLPERGFDVIEDLPRVEEWREVPPARFAADILSRRRPAVLRNAAESWPLVREGRRSPEALVAYLTGFYNGELVSTVTAPPEARGRLFYRADMEGLNYKVSTEKLPSVLKGLLKQLEAAEPWAIAIQGMIAAQHLPGLEEENPFDLVPSGTGGRLWIGNKVTVAPHFDVADNIACVVAGRRRFILFPPDQLPNLYVGPFDLTPAGVPVSMVSLDEPDLERFPRYRAALAAAQVAELEPGDAIFIPYMWWHGVQSLERFNVLANYWWNDSQVAAEFPYGALLHAAYILYRDMPAEHRQIWRGMYEYYAFGIRGEPMEHLAPEHRGSYPPIDAEVIVSLKAGISALVQPKKGSER